jgi:hypothetical protein
MGSLYKPSTKDADGNALQFKSGANVGQPRVNYFLALAIPKGPEGHWSRTEWGQLIYQTGLAAFPQAHLSPTFAWKVTDGDDATPNIKGKRACNTEGFPGNWILRFSGSFAPKVYREESGAYVQVTEENYIKPGYYVQISCTVSGNSSQQRPGLYLNHSMVAFAGFGQEIHFGPDANSVGFGQAPLPAGAMSTPVASSVPLPSVPVHPQYGQTVVPKPSFLTVPQVASVSVHTAAFPPPPAPASVSATMISPSRTMTAKAAGSSYQAFKTAGWTDEALIAQGYLA